MYFFMILADEAQNISENISTDTFISIIALVISIASAAFQYWGNKNINKISMETSLCKEIYMVYLIKKIPEARLKIHYDGSKLLYTDKLVKVLNDIRRDSIHYNYTDKKYYDKLVECLRKIEDMLVESEKMNNQEYVIFASQLDKKFDVLYKIIMEKYLGK